MIRALVPRAFVAIIGAGCSEPTPARPPDAAIAVDGTVTDAETRPEPPAALTRWLVGDPADRVTDSQGGIILMGGGADVDAAFAWQRGRIGGGDIVVLRTSGANGYNDYLFAEIGGADSVETLRVDTRALADDPYVRWTLEHAEAIFLAGGDQATYVDAWRGTAVTAAIQTAAARGAVIGGTSAGCAFLGGIVYTGAAGSVYSDEALEDPYNSRMTLVRDVVALPALAGVVTDTHFRARDRMGRLVAFTARIVSDGWAQHPLGIGVDEKTALVIDHAGLGTVIGSGSVYMIAATTAPTTCAPNTPLAWAAIPRFALTPGATVALPAGTTQVAPLSLSATSGALEPANPY
ncbi:MAG: cyanophycinase [Myxococcota bacterium]|nr:cyanophycinase [Myxococcota bacterium]